MHNMVSKNFMDIHTDYALSISYTSNISNFYRSLDCAWKIARASWITTRASIEDLERFSFNCALISVI